MKVAAQAIQAGIAGELAAGQVRQPVTGPDPKGSVEIGGQRADEIVRQSVGGSELPDMSIVQKIQPIRGADPQVSSCAPGQGKDNIAG